MKDSFVQSQLQASSVWRGRGERDKSSEGRREGRRERRRKLCRSGGSEGG